MNTDKKPLLVDSSGQELLSQRFAPCPKCGRPADARVPSGGFGELYLICPCGNEFNKELRCPRPIL